MAKSSREKNSEKKSKRSLGRIIIIIILIVILGVSIFKIIEWAIDSINIVKQMAAIEEKVNIVEVVDNEKTEIIKQVKKPKEFDPYWDYINMNLINVDFEELKEVNKYTAGWIQVAGTNINYPIVQAYNNNHFLWYDFEGNRNNAGWIFMDYRNNKTNFDRNTIIYGHSRTDNTMFGTLKNIMKNGWYDNKDNHVIKLSTEHENTLWQVFSVYHVPETSDYIQVDFISDDEYKTFLDKISDRTMLKFDTEVGASDKILTLSTCYDNNNQYRLVVHSKLIKRDIK